MGGWGRARRRAERIASIIAIGVVVAGIGLYTLGMMGQGFFGNVKVGLLYVIHSLQGTAAVAFCWLASRGDPPRLRKTSVRCRGERVLGGVADVIVEFADANGLREPVIGYDSRTNQLLFVLRAQHDVGTGWTVLACVEREEDARWRVDVRTGFNETAARLGGQLAVTILRYPAINETAPPLPAAQAEPHDGACFPR